MATISPGVNVSSSPWPTQPGNPHEQAAWQVALQAVTAGVMWLMAVFGNCLVVLVVRRSRRLQSTTNYFVVSLALADLLVALFCMPLILVRVVSQRWLLGNLLCKVVRFMQYVAPSVAIFVLVGISVDRFYTILYPLSFKITRGKAQRIVIVSWCLAIALSCPTFYFFEVDDGAAEYPFCDTYIDHAPGSIMYVAFVVLAEYLLPLLVVFVIYTRVVRHIWRVGVGVGRLQRTANAVPRTKVKTVKMLMIVSSLYFALWGPFFVAQLWFAASADRSAAVPGLYVATVWVAFGASACNPIVYSYYNPNFRRGCREVFCMSTMRCYRSNTYAITSSSRFARRNHVGIAPSTTTSAMNRSSERLRPPSPYKTFDRDMNGDKKMAWPLPNVGQSTYL